MVEFASVGIVGSGIMGAGIAETAITSGYRIVLLSRTADSARAMAEAVQNSLNRNMERGKATPALVEEQIERLTATSEISDLAGCDMVVETVIEDFSIKSRIISDLDIVCKPSAIIASNTSTLPITELAAATNRPDKICGIHFFNPAPLMKLVEIVRTLLTSDDTILKATRFAISCGKEPVEVQDRAGFIVNALLFPYLNNAVKMLEQHVGTKEGIDNAMKGACDIKAFGKGKYWRDWEGTCLLALMACRQASVGFRSWSKGPGT